MKQPQYLEESLNQMNNYIDYPTTKDRIEALFEKVNLPPEIEDYITRTLPEGTYKTYSEVRYALGLR